MLKRVLLILLVMASFLAAKTIDTITIKGFDESKLKPLIGIKVGDRYTPSKILEAKKIIRQVLGSSGYKNSAVSSSISDKGQAVGVTFRVSKGHRVTISKINFVGNRYVTAEELSAKLVNKEAQAMGWFPGRSSGVANIPQLKYDAMRVQDEYYKRGYLDAKVAQPTISINQESGEAVVTYKIQEGKKYKVSKVDFKMSQVHGVSRNSLASGLKLRSGNIFSVSDLRDDIKNVTTELRNAGYAYAKVTPAFMKNPVSKKISVQYRVYTGSRATIGNISIKGNKKTKENVVRRYIDLAPGDLYNYETLKESKKALSRTGFFEDVKIKSAKASTPTKINLEVDVKEAKTGAFSIGGGYGSADGWMINGSIKDRNIFGTGMEVGAEVDYSKVAQSFALSIKEPRLFNSKYSVSAGIFKKDYDYTQRDTYSDLAYDEKNEFGGYVSLGKSFTNNIYASIGYSYRDVEYDGIKNTLENPINEEDYFNYVKSAVTASLVYNSTDDYYTPRSGVYARIGFEYAGLGSAPAGKALAEFTKYDTKLAFFYGLQDEIDYDLIMRFKFKGSYIDHDEGKYVPVAERLYLGGANRGVRGFKAGSISPKRDGYRSGGYRSYVTSVEASIPLSVSSNMRLTFFLDYGEIGEDNLDITQKSAGAQVEWKSPFGPINLIFAKAIDPDEAHGSIANFEFNIGGKF